LVVLNLAAPHVSQVRRSDAAESEKKRHISSRINSVKLFHAFCNKLERLSLEIRIKISCTLSGMAEFLFHRETLRIGTKVLTGDKHSSLLAK